VADRDGGSSGLRFESGDGIAWIWLDRPEHGNSLTREMQSELPRLWQAIAADGDVGVVVVTGTGQRHFCTGTDVKTAAREGTDRPGRGTSVSEFVRLTARQNDVWKPVICAVNGLAAGAGLHFVVDADIVVAAEGASFTDAHVNVGAVGALENIGLAKRMPLGSALRLTLMGRAYRMSAGRAYQLGFVDELVAPEALLDTCSGMAKAMLENSPAAMAASQRAIWQSLEMSYEEALEHGWTLIQQQWEHPDYLEGPRAFAERRAPVWADRTRVSGPSEEK
jgi:E-phenylitaconyl-CoA hydratase